MNFSHPEIFKFSEDIHLEVIYEYLANSKSCRQIQKEILNLPAPARGGGFVAMNILHYHGFKGVDKGKFESISKNNKSSIIKKIKELVIYKEKLLGSLKHNNSFDTSSIKTTEITAEVKQRVGQNVLRNLVLSNYGYKCAICEINKIDLLVCSHIAPWKLDQLNRLNQSNAICFCPIHDKLFDKGYFSLSDKFEIIISKKADQAIKNYLKNVTFRKPSQFEPDCSFLKFHREEILK